MGTRTRSHSPSEHAVLGALLKSSRLKAGLTQVMVADKLGQRQSFIAKVERGERQVTALEFRDMCGLYGVSPTEVLGSVEG